MIAITLHIFYIEDWDFFREKLEKLNINFDLYISLTDGNKDISDLIFKSFPLAKIFTFPNVGADITPFLHIFNLIRNEDYDYLIKLHTKSIKSTCHEKWKKAGRWRALLVDCLIGSDEVVNSNINVLKTKKFAMCGSKRWHKIQKWKMRYEPWEARTVYEFIGGTMFMVDFKKYIKRNSTKEKINPGGVKFFCGGK